MKPLSRCRRLLGLLILLLASPLVLALLACASSRDTHETRHKAPAYRRTAHADPEPAAPRM